MVSNWKPAHSLVEDTHLWDQDWSSHLPSNSGCHSPASLPPTEGREQRAVHSRLALLWYCLSPLFCEQHRLCFKAFCGKVLFFFFPPLWLSHTLGCCLNVSSLRLSSGHSGPVLTLSNAAHASLFSPHLLVAFASIWATPLGVAVRRVICGFYLFIFSSQLCCPLKFQNSP